MNKNTLILSAAVALGALAVVVPAMAAEPAAEPAPAADPGALKSIMVGLGQDMGALYGALWVNDLEAVSTAALAVANHPRVSPEEMTRVKTALGQDFGGFAQADKAVHDAGVRLSEAAKAGDMERTLVELAALETGCVSCHDGYRERLK